LATQLAVLDHPVGRIGLSKGDFKEAEKTVLKNEKVSTKDI
jgi:hypothetical protein